MADPLRRAFQAACDACAARVSMPDSTRARSDAAAATAAAAANTHAKPVRAAVALWTPVVVYGSALAGGSIARLAERWLGHSPTAWVLALIAVFAVIALARRSWGARRAIWRTIRRATRFEFWPTWAIYAPLAPFFAWNALRFGFARTLTAVNPCWPDSGVVGDSKQAGLDAFDAGFVSPSFRVDPAEDGTMTDEIIERALSALERAGWTDDATGDASGNASGKASDTASSKAPIEDSGNDSGKDSCKSSSDASGKAACDASDADVDRASPESPTDAARGGRGGDARPVTGRASGATVSRTTLGRDGAWARPVIVKPDAGLRGYGVKLARDAAGFRAALHDARASVVVQRYEPGACEVGLFVIAPRGSAPRLFSICEKRFPHAVGDGRSTLGELIARDARLSLQEPVFRARFAARLGEVPAAGERVRLGLAGNHSQGCLFVDGARLRTPELEAWVARAAGGARGFHYGRLDVLFPDERACRRGEGGAILEANGVTSESTDMYDPSWSCWRAWRTMRAHWREAFRIGAANRAAGVPGMTLGAVLARRRAWLRDAHTDDIAH